VEKLKKLENKFTCWDCHRATNRQKFGR